MSKQKITYTEAVAELENILAELEQTSDVNMEVIAEKVKRAGVLMTLCKTQLHSMNADLDKILSELDV